MSNDFLPFGTAGGANVMTQADYLALAARTAGFSAGTAVSAQLNKAWRQSSVIAAVIGQLVSDRSGNNALDDGNTAALLASLELAIAALARNDVAAYATSSGAANVQTVTYTPAPALTDGIVLKFKAGFTNTGATTLNVNGLGAKAVVGAAHQALQGGEITATGDVWVQYNTSVGGGSWVIMAESAGPLQVIDAVLSRHAVALGQLNGTLAANGYITIPVVVSGIKRNIYFQWGVSTGTTTSVNINFPVAAANQVLWLGLQDSGGSPNLSVWTYATVLAAFTAFNIGTLTKSATTVGASVSANAQWFAITW